MTIAVDFDEKRIDSIFDAINQCHFPGVAVGVAIGGSPVYRKGFGSANMELPVVLGPSMRLRIYSTTKHFTCLAYLLLCEEGKAAVEDSVGKWLPELNPVTHRVTMLQLMAHESGLRDAQDLRWQFSGMERPVASEDLLSLYRNVDDVNFAPGSAWRYNNGAYVILSAAIERIAGEPLEEILRHRIFEPIGMHDTLLRRYDSDFLANSATLHTTTATGDFVKSYIAGALAGEGGVVSTVDDMLRWLHHMRTPVIGSARTWQMMKSARRLANGTSTGYALGLTVSPYRGIETLHHAGGGRGGNSQMLKVPAADLDIVILCNRHDVLSGLLANRILDACLPDLEPVPARSKRPALTGVFQSATTGRVVQLCTAPGIPENREADQIVSIDGTDMPFDWDEEGMLHPAGLASSMKWSVRLPGDPARLSSIDFWDFGNLDTLGALASGKSQGAEAIVGRYRSATTGSEARISEFEGRARLDTAGRFASMAYDLECLAGGIWRARSTDFPSLGGILAFDEQSGGFNFSSYCTSRLRFGRRE